MTDLTKLTTPFGLLDRETQDALRANGLLREIFTGSQWKVTESPHWVDKYTYRARPAPLVPDSIDWSHVAPKVRYMARDRHDDFSHFFEQKPYASGKMWCVDEGNTLGITRAFASYKRGTVAWQDSLVARPEGM